MQVALAFVNDPAASTHGNVCVHSVFISPSGEWKLGGFETLSNAKDEAAVLYVSKLWHPIYRYLTTFTSLPDHGGPITGVIRARVSRSEERRLVYS